MAAAFDPAMIDTFKKGILERTPALVEQALDHGVDPATPIKGYHPLLLLLSQDAREDEDKKNTSSIVRTLLARGAKVAEPDKYATADYSYLADRLILSERLADSSEIVLKALHETASADRPVYKPDLDRQIAGYISIIGATPESDFKDIVSHTVTLLETVHETVRKRLQNPQTDLEKDLVENHADKISHWMQAFERPPLRMLLADLGLSVDGRMLSPAQSAAPAASEAFAQAAEDPFSKEMAQYVTRMQKRDPQQVLTEMQSDFIGLDGVKRDARKMVLREQFDAARAVMDLPDTQKSYSTVLLGNPGVGKTTVARKKAELMHSLGITGPNYVEVSRENLVGAYVGHTEKKMLALFMQADVVFIDEAYNLSDGRPDSQDFGKKVVDALMLALENRRDKLTVFFAGYPEEMEAFLSSNPGLKSRIGFYETLEDPTIDQLGQVLDQRLAKGGFSIEPEARQLVLEELAAAKKKLGAKYFGNAREVRKIAEQIPDAVAERLFGNMDMSDGMMTVPDKSELTRVTLADIQSMNLREMLGGKELSKPSTGYGGTRIGFTAKI